MTPEFRSQELDDIFTAVFANGNYGYYAVAAIVQFGVPARFAWSSSNQTLT